MCPCLFVATPQHDNKQVMDIDLVSSWLVNFLFWNKLRSKTQFHWPSPGAIRWYFCYGVCLLLGYFLHQKGPRVPVYKLEWVLYVLTQTWPEAGDGSKKAMKWRGIYIFPTVYSLHLPHFRSSLVCSKIC